MESVSSDERQDRRLAVRAGIVGVVMIVGWVVSGQLTVDWFNPVE